MVEINLRIPTNDSTEVSILESPIPLLIILQTFLKCESKMTLLSTKIVRNFDVGNSGIND